MTLDEIHDEWAKDSVIDDTKLDTESLIIPQIHHKYYKMYLTEKMVLIKHKSELDTLHGDLWQWYEGGISKDRLDELKWDQNDMKVKVKSQIPLLIEKDPRYIKLSFAVSLQLEKVEFLKEIIKNLNNRNFLIKNAIEHRKFTNA